MDTQRSVNESLRRQKTSSLCHLCVLCVSVVVRFCGTGHHRDTENTEVAQRRSCSRNGFSTATETCADRNTLSRSVETRERCARPNHPATGLPRGNSQTAGGEQRQAQ